MPALFLAVFIDLVGFGMVIPLLPFYAQRYDASPEIVTLLVAIYSIASFVCAPLWGRLSDRIGRRPVLLITLAGSVGGYLWLAFTDSLVLLFLARAFSGGMSANVGVAHAYISDSTTPATRARALGQIGAAFGLGFVTGPALGGLLAGADPATADYQLPFLAAAGLSFLAFLAAIALVKESLSAAARAAALARQRRGRLVELLAAIRRPYLGRLIVLTSMTPFVFSTFESIFALWSERALGWGPEQNGYFYAFMGVIAVLAQGGAVGPLVRLTGERGTVLIGAAAVGLGMLATPLAPDLAGLCIATALIVFGVCVTGSALTSLVSQQAGAHEQGAVLGVAQSASGLARIAGPLWSGYSFAALGRNWPFFISAAVMLLMLAIAWRIEKRPRPAGSRTGRAGAPPE